MFPKIVERPHARRAAHARRSYSLNRAAMALLLLSLGLAACGTVNPTASAAPKPEIALSDCLLTSPGLTASLKAKCGTWTVPEDRANPSGWKIDLKVAIVSAVSRRPAPDPLFFLTGGPGQAATESYVALASAFDRIGQKRDIVLVDQRGTGQSNPLTCPSSVEASDETNLDEAEAQAQSDQAVKDCLAQLKGDPRFYTTSIAVQDLDEVRAALGYAKINLYGLSYGTRVAQTYLQLYPDHVRAVILDGVVPQTQALGTEVARDAQRALDLIFARCALSADCNQAFPNLRTEFETLLAALEKEPVTLTLAHPVTGKSTQTQLTASSVAFSVRMLSYAPETVALLPLLIHAAAQGNYTPLAAQSLMLSQDLKQVISAGMNASVICAEDAPFLRADQAAQANAGTYYGDRETRQIAQLCSIWPHGEVPADFKQAVSASAPVLLLSGEADPVTPPANAELVAQTLPNSLRLVMAGQGHNVIYRGCLPRVAADFISSGQTQGLDTACVQDIKPMPFFVDFTGTKP